MDVTVLLLLAASGALLIPLLGGGDDGGDDGEIRGTYGNDSLDGTEEDDVILAWQGDDIINGLGGDDLIKPGEGEDTVDGGEGDDNIKGSPGDDDLTGGGGFDTIFGGADNDIIDGGADADFLAGGDGNDVIYGGYGHSGSGGVPIDSDRGPEFMRGDDGDDRLFIWGEGGEARGNDGDDELILVTGDATLEAGAGASDDFYVFANFSDAQLTEATIADFDPTRDTLTLTIDHVPDAGTPPDVDVTMTQTQVDGVNGVRVDAVYTGPGVEPADSEAAVAFLPGATLAQLSSANIEAVLTTNADLTDPDTTLTDVIAARAAVPPPP